MNPAASRSAAKSNGVDWFTNCLDPAYAIKNELHISQASWSKACARLGETGAAICILITGQGAQREENRVMKPAAYFTGMTQKFERRELRLHNPIFGLLKTEE